MTVLLKYRTETGTVSLLCDLLVRRAICLAQIQNEGEVHPTPARGM